MADKEPEVQDELAESLNDLFTSLSSMVKSELQGTNNILELLEKMNLRVAEEYKGFGDVASGLRVFVEQLKNKSGNFDEYVQQIDAIEQQVTEFEAVISVLDRYVSLLESKIFQGFGVVQIITTPFDVSRMFVALEIFVVYARILISRISRIKYNIHHRNVLMLFLLLILITCFSLLVLQYRSSGETYLYDIGSTHGTFINKSQVTKRTYVDLRAGDVILFGLSSRLYIFQGSSELMPQIMEELENLEESLNDSICESIGACGGTISCGKRKGGPEDDDDEDFSSDNDELYDRTKKKPTVQKVGETQFIETADSLLDTRDAIMKEIEGKKQLLLSEKNKMASETALETEVGDAFDAYMSGLSFQLGET
ncbi:hypothetical protein CRYUN_Cryun01aG0106100 [Craigia yunnanensis]